MQEPCQMGIFRENLIAPMVTDSFVHGQQVFNRDLGLNIVDRVEYKPSAFSKNLQTLAHLGAYFIRLAKRQNSLGSTPPPQNVTCSPKRVFSTLGSMFAAEVCTGFRMSNPA